MSVIKNFGMKLIPGLQITLISPDVQTPYSGMLPGFVAGHYAEEDIHIDLVALCRFAGVRFILDRATGLDTRAQKIQTREHPDIAYDVLSIDIGITPVIDDIPGAKANVIPVKPVHQFVDRWTDFLSRISENEIDKIGVVGGGAGGLELCLAIHHRIEKERFPRNAGQKIPEIHLFSDGDILEGHNGLVRAAFTRTLKEKRIKLHNDFKVVSIENRVMISSAGAENKLDEIFWVTHAASQVWLGLSGLSVDSKGFIRVKETLQTLSHPNIFAAGDVASVVDHPRPKAGVFAVRQGPPLCQNLRRVLEGKSPLPFRPQNKFLSLISKGEKSAVASKGFFKAEGKWVWRWKNWIDQRFMNNFNCLPEMRPLASGGLVSLEEDEMHCGGCGAKLGAEMLSSVLLELDKKYMTREIRNTNVIIGLNEPDDAAVISVPQGKVLVQTTDHFRTFLDDPYVFAKIGIYHAMSDLYAMGVVPDSVLAMVSLPFGRPEKLQQLLQQMMCAVMEVMNQEEVSLIGGHTGEAAELSLGFTVNGFADESDIWLKSGLEEGDCLILTKPLGTGALLAADMQYQAKGQWVRDATEEMLRSNRQAMEIFRKFEIRGCTDVTGFGLAGHLLEMLQASHQDAVVFLDELPVMTGACEVINDLGIRSSLHQSNQLVENNISNYSMFSNHSNYQLMFDPQTSGGLLAAVNRDQSSACLQELRQKGYAASKIVGQVIGTGKAERSGGNIRLYTGNR